jgi:hypothetical protein
VIQMSVLPAYRMDAILSRAGSANARCFYGVQKRYMRALDVTKSTASRHFRGENSPSTRFLFQIASADKATAWPILAEAVAIVRQVDIEKASTDELEAQRMMLTDAEHTAEADADRANVKAVANPTPENLDAAADANVRIGEIVLELAAVQRELAHRKRRGL